MDEFAKELEEVREHVEPVWDDARHQRLKARVFARPTRIRPWVKVSGGLVLAAAAAAMLVWWPSESAERTAERGAEPSGVTHIEEPPGDSVENEVSNVVAEAATLTLRDGSTVRPAASASIQVLEDVEGRSELELSAGSAVFDVVPDPDRVFRVAAGPVSVEVLGTSFTVAREGEQSSVEVRRGRVRVRWEGGEAVLARGESGRFPPAEPVVGPESAEESVEVERPVRSTRRRAAAEPEAAPEPAPTPWETLARDGRYGDAYEALEQEGGAARVRGSAQELMLAADVARLSGHPRRALEPLQRTLREYARDPRAPLAAFTLGRVYLEELGQPREAASTFARARRLSPGGSLAEDALAREVEAWDRAGEAGRAREVALEYLRLFPSGRRVSSVRRHGGLE
ncbi:MAG: FecR domain-containing protein [Myxococcota bacterium]